MLPRNESGMRKFSVENWDRSRAELPWGEPAVLRDFKLMMNLFVSTEGCTVKDGLVLLGIKCRKEM